MKIIQKKIISNFIFFPLELWIKIILYTNENPIKYLSINTAIYNIRNVLLANYFRNKSEDQLNQIGIRSLKNENKLLYNFLKKNCIGAFKKIVLCRGNFRRICQHFCIMPDGQRDVLTNFYIQKNNSTYKWLKKWFVWDYSIKYDSNGPFCSSCWWQIMGI